MAEQRDVQALAETVREGLSKVQALDGQVCRCPSCVNAAERLAALDEFVLEHTRQEEALRTIVVFSEGAAGAIYRAESMREVALAALSSPPVASGEQQ